MCREGAGGLPKASDRSAAGTVGRECGTDPKPELPRGARQGEGWGARLGRLGPIPWAVGVSGPSGNGGSASRSPFSPRKPQPPQGRAAPRGSLRGHSAPAWVDTHRAAPVAFQSQAPPPPRCPHGGVVRPSPGVPRFQVTPSTTWEVATEVCDFPAREVEVPAGREEGVCVPTCMRGRSSGGRLSWAFN